MMMWPDCSPPRLKPFSRILSMTERSPTAVRCSVRPRSTEDAPGRGWTSPSPTPGVARAALVGPARGDQRHDLIAVDDIAVLVADDQPVGVAIQSDADIGRYFATWIESAGAVEPTSSLMLSPSGDADRDHLGPQFLQRFGATL